MSLKIDEYVKMNTVTSVPTIKSTELIYNRTDGSYYGWEEEKSLCFTANTAGSTITMSVTGTPTLDQNFSYSTDNGANWCAFIPGTTSITFTKVGDKVYFKGNNPNGISESNSIYYKFVTTGSIASSGNIMSLIDNGKCNTSIIPNAYCFYKLFYNNTALTSTPDLPATILTIYCYQYMFYGCTNIISTPDLPATTLTQSCYHDMFSYCTSLTTVRSFPATSVAGSSCDEMFFNCSALTYVPSILPATALGYSCYRYMFANCTSLTTAPELPAMTLISNCYDGMFINCTSLINAPELPATTLAYDCYYNMFNGCTSLIAAPTLPATTFERFMIGCYGHMFEGCTSLTIVPNLSSVILPTSCYASMFKDCTSLYVSDSRVTGVAEHEWRIPTSGTISSANTQKYMFTSCLGTRSSDNMAGESGQSYTYYTQNEPV